MRYENYGRATQIVEEIKKMEDKISNIGLDNLSVKVAQGTYGVLSVKADSELIDPLSKHAADFIKKCKASYNYQLQELHQELSKL